MITDEALRSLARKFQTTELNVKREYFQHLFLSNFYQQPLTDQVFFKGGTALRMIYNSPRFSEDLDFSSNVNDANQIEAALLETLIAINRENIDIDLVESTITSGGYLAIINFHTEGQITVSIQLEISLREGEKRGEAVTIASDYVPAYTIISLMKEQLVDEKIKAFLTRKKARDFYDLYFILRANLISTQKKDILSQAMETLSQTSINFEKELKEFLPRSHWAIIRNFPIPLKREIERFL
jgi:predicted nucleotidyltransferase component of viral defense system